MPSTEEEHDFTSASANASLTIPAQASSLKQSDYILLQSHYPCRITKLSTSKPGKHGYAKAAITAVDIFTAKKYEDVFPAHANVQVPIVKKKSYLVLDVEEEGYLSLWDQDKGEQKNDVKVPEGEVGEGVKKAWKTGGGNLLIVVMSAMGVDMVESWKEGEKE
ncbi:MAG: hypothetical protein LQ352_006091 [Teloschistes flavicans]|nr:MAG: hypothetical protein LQ352_006091 [Teloschistes flavicans]